MPAARERITHYANSPSGSTASLSTTGSGSSLEGPNTANGNPWASVNGKNQINRRFDRRTSMHNIVKMDNLRKKMQLKRLVEKGGACNVIHRRSQKSVRNYMSDIFTTLVDLRWRWVLIFFSLSYIISWLVFGGFWYGLAWWHDDLHYLSRNETDMPEFWNEPCVYNMEGWRGAFLMSIETQTTIGYGVRTVTEECWVGVFIVIWQSVISQVIDAVLVGCIFCKISRPKKRAATLKFSKNAVIAERDGKLCLMLRLGDIRQSHLYDCNIRAELIQAKITQEGECMPLHAQRVEFNIDGGIEGKILLIWPIIVSHVIDEDSPFYNMSKEDLADNVCFELLVILEGTIENTGLLCQARTSYLPEEIIWGHRFSSHIIHPHEPTLTVDYREFNTTYPVQETSLCSAKELALQREQDAEKLYKKKYNGQNGRVVCDKLPIEAEDNYDNDKIKHELTRRNLRFNDEVSVFESDEKSPLADGDTDSLPSYRQCRIESDV